MLGEQRNQNHTGFWMNIFDLGHFSFRILYSNVLLKIYHIIQVFGAHFLPFEHTFPVIPPTLSYQLSKLQKKFQEENVWGRCCWETFPCMAGRPVPNNASWSLGPICQICVKFVCNFMQFHVFHADENVFTVFSPRGAAAEPCSRWRYTTSQKIGHCLNI